MRRTETSGLRSLPSVDRLLAHPRLDAVRGRLSREWMTPLARLVLEEARTRLRSGAGAVTADGLAGELESRCRELRFGGLRRVVNATGVLLHTNLGRAHLPAEAARSALEHAAGTVSVELDLETGERGNRYGTVQKLLSVLTGCESSVVVNNNAAAVLLVLSTFARGRDVVLSRGEMIEIGGSFRLPEIIRSSGANLIEVGATNRTHLADYRRAISPATGLLMKAHTSNYRVVGFTQQVSALELMKLSRETGVPVYEDLGSGSFVDLTRYGLTAEPTVQQVVASGIPLVSFSGDKLLGGPQAGIVVGTRELVGPLLENHLLRALRVDKMTMALLEKTLQAYLDPAGPETTVPTHQLLSRKVDALERAAEEVLALAAAEELVLRVKEDSAAVGGGACPTDRLATRVIEVTHPNVGPDELSRRFRKLELPVLGRIREDRFCLDVRTVPPGEYAELAQALRTVDRQLQEER